MNGRGCEGVKVNGQGGAYWAYQWHAEHTCIPHTSAHDRSCFSHGLDLADELLRPVSDFVFQHDIAPCVEVTVLRWEAV